MNIETDWFGAVYDFNGFQLLSDLFQFGLVWRLLFVEFLLVFQLLFPDLSDFGWVWGAV